MEDLLGSAKIPEESGVTVNQTDLNCDLGEWKTSESRRLDKKIMPFISSCNIACGGHIGDEDSVKRTIDLAMEHEVAIGVHPSYPDRENFGRIVPDISHERLKDSLFEQLSSFKKLLSETEADLHHIKPHGALYNNMSSDPQTVRTFVKVVNEVFPSTRIYLASGSRAEMEAKASGMKVISEVFADRVYEEDLSLRDRSLEEALLTETEDVIAQVRHFVFSEKVITYSGSTKFLDVESICVHSDTPGASNLAKTINQFLREHGISITAP